MVIKRRTFPSIRQKHTRRTKVEMDAIKDAIYEVTEQDQPCTLRQVFYRLVTMVLVLKTEREYTKTVGRLVGEMRKNGQLPWEWIIDYTREMRKPLTYLSPHDAIQDAVDCYRRGLWHDLDDRVEIWLEKDALVGVLYQETSKYDVPLMPSRGYSSLTFLHDAAEAIVTNGKPAHLYYFGDHDPSGVDIPRNIEAQLREFAPNAVVHFNRVAVTPQQIRHWKLPTRPTKTGDSRASSFKGESVELDAIPPDQLRTLCRECIEQHLNDDILDEHYEQQDADRKLLTKWGRRVSKAC